MIAYSIEQAKENDLITRSIVSTDSEEIAEVARKYGGEVPFMRPKELAKDDTPHLPVMKHAVEEMEKIDGIVYDYVLIFQPTSPFRRREDIDGSINKLIETGLDSLITVCEVDTNKHPVKMRVFDGEKLKPICEHFEIKEGTRRQDFPPIYKRNSAIFAMKRDTYMKKNSLMGDSTAGYVMPIELSCDIDELPDFKQAEFMLEDLRDKGYDF